MTNKLIYVSAMQWARLSFMDQVMGVIINSLVARNFEKIPGSLAGVMPVKLEECGLEIFRR